MCICMYTYVYIYMCVYVCIYMCICMYMYMYNDIYMYICVYVYMYMCFKLALAALCANTVETTHWLNEFYIPTRPNDITATGYCATSRIYL